MARIAHSPLTVRELLEQLKDADPDQPVLVECDDGNGPHTVLRLVVDSSTGQTPTDLDNGEGDWTNGCANCGRSFESEGDALILEGRPVHAYCDLPKDL